MRILGYIMLALIVFFAVLFGVAWAKGELTRENLERVFKREAVKQAPEKGPDELDPLIRELKAREERLDAREAKIAQEENRLRSDQAHLDELRTELEDTLQRIRSALDDADVDQEKRLKQAADNIAAMKAKNAAKAFENWDAEEAAKVLRLMDDRRAGKVLDEMEPGQASAVLRHLKGPEY
ncbi:MAG TPA: hypothetical protein HPP83_10525 [Candidatus Hydrogenedentes bacterium]|nr:hypothetical protein [Candidatus Hydrogenedentota bacterium]